MYLQCCGETGCHRGDMQDGDRGRAHGWHGPIKTMAFGLAPYLGLNFESQVISLLLHYRAGSCLGAAVEAQCCLPRAQGEGWLIREGGEQEKSMMTDAAQTMEQVGSWRVLSPDNSTACMQHSPACRHAAGAAGPCTSWCTPSQSLPTKGYDPLIFKGQKNPVKHCKEFIGQWAERMGFFMTAMIINETLWSLLKPWSRISDLLLIVLSVASSTQKLWCSI